MRIVVLPFVAAVLSPVAWFTDTAEAHVCDPADPASCQETPVVDNWRDNYVPLFDLADRDDPDQRREAQRWREECGNQQQCAWLYSGSSANGSGAPNEVHAGTGASHCFAFELFHDCSDHACSETCDPAHDSHGGAIYVDVCLAENDDPALGTHCDDGLSDTQAGVTVVDHNPCGIVVPVAACTDEYHVVRPLDDAYTATQVQNTRDSVDLIAADPARYLCGHHPSGQNCRDAVNTLLDLLTP